MRNGWSQDAEIEERKTTERHNERRGVRGAKREPLELGACLRWHSG